MAEPRLEPGPSAWQTRASSLGYRRILPGRGRAEATSPGVQHVARATNTRLRYHMWYAAYHMLYGKWAICVSNARNPPKRTSQIASHSLARERRFFFVSRWYAGVLRTCPGTPQQACRLWPVVVCIRYTERPPLRLGTVQGASYAPEGLPRPPCAACASFWGAWGRENLQKRPQKWRIFRRIFAKCF